MMRHRPGLFVLVVTLASAAVAQLDVRAQQRLPRLQAPAYRFDAARLDAIADARLRGLNYIPGEVVLKFKPGMGPNWQQRALDVVRSRPRVADLEWMGDTAVLRDLNQPNAIFLARQLASQPEVAYAEPNYLRRLPVQRSRAILDTGAPGIQATPNDPHYGLLQWNFTLLDMPRAWDINPGANSSVIVAVVDSGITTQTQTINFPLYTGSSIQTVPLPFAVSTDLSTSRLLLQRDFAFSTSATQVQDMDGHGTHVASTIAEDTNNSFRAAGIAYNARIIPVKVCLGYWDLMIMEAAAGRPGFRVDPETNGTCPTSALVAGIRYAADSGAKVINVSIGGPGASNAERDAIAYAVGRGAFVAMSAGNEFEDDNPTMYPAAFAATINGAMSVAATGKSQRRAYYSSTGNWVEIAAPGGDFKDGGGQDQGYIWQTTLLYTDQDPDLLIPRFDNYATIGYQGTSMASPHVAGLAALLVSQGITRPEAIESLIRATAKDLGTTGKDNDFGYGLIQPRAALRGLGIRK